MNCNLISQILMLAMNGQLGNCAAQNPATACITSNIKSVAGKDKKTTQDEIEKQISVFTNQLSTMQMFAAIPQFSSVISPMMTNIKNNISALQLVDDNFDAFSNNKDYISTKTNSDDLSAIEDAAEEDDNEADFSDEDLEALYDERSIEMSEDEEDGEMSKLEAARIILDNYDDVNIDEKEYLTKKDIKKAFKTTDDEELKEALGIVQNDKEFFDELDNILVTNNDKLLSEDDLNKFIENRSTEVLAKNINSIKGDDQYIQMGDITSALKDDDLSAELTIALETFKNQSFFDKVETIQPDYPTKDGDLDISDLNYYKAAA